MQSIEREIRKNSVFIIIISIELILVYFIILKKFQT